MKIDEFIKETNSEYNHAYEMHVKNIYVPIEKKQARAKTIVQSACYITTEDGGKQYHVNSVAIYVLTGLTYVDLYTDIERGENILEDFNKLNEICFFEDMKNFISEREREEFEMVLDMELEDLEKNEYELGAFIRNQVERFATLFGTALAPVLENIDLDKVKEQLEEYVK